MNTLLPGLVHRPDGPDADHPAIVSADGELTYGEMWDRVSAVVALLLRADVAPGDRVGLFLPRSADYVVCLLATLWVGATAVPLDTEFPPARITRMLEMAQPRIVLRGDQAPRADGDTRWLELGEPWRHTPTAELPPSRASEEHAALILFTSGSTGSPKGVLLNHAALGNRLVWGRDRYGFGPTDRMLHKASIAFDASVQEIFPPLVAGGTLVIAPRGLQFDSLGLVRLMQDAGVTAAHFVPSLLRYVVDEEEFAYCGDLRLVCSGGEVLDRPLMERFRQTLTCSLFNQYGPTETAVNATYWDCDEPFDGDTVPIGRPLPGVTCHVLDEDLVPVAPGVVGELWIGGVAVGLGYLDNPAETAERFRVDPFEGSGRLYRTGDRARLNPGGYLEFHGRIDDQVKVRGVRVEPDEVAAVLRGHPSIVDAAVVADRDGSGEVRLNAYIAARRRDSPVVDGRHRIQLPNGMAVVAPSPDEALFLYRQIFEEDEYARFGIDIPQDAVVVDVGANIGTFALWVGSRAPDARIVAVEPNPDVLPYLRTNLDLYGLHAEVVPMAVTDEVGTAELMSFPQLTYLSGLGERHDAAVALVRSHYDSVGESMTGDERHTFLNDMGDRLHGTRHVVRTTDLTSLFDRLDLPRIDLLKVNVEGSELRVMRSLDREHWSRVAQVCVEVERSGAVAPEICSLLRDVGFETHEISDWSVSAAAEVSYVYAVRPGIARAAAASAPAEVTPPLSARSVRAYLADRLPAAMHPARFVFLDELPRLPNGKIARAELPPPPAVRDKESDGGADRTSRLREVWRQALGVDSVLDDDNFVALGGHSLIALRISAHLREVAQVVVRPTACMDAPTFADWLTELDHDTGSREQDG